MNTRRALDDYSNEQVSSKRRKSLDEKAPHATMKRRSTADVAMLNNLGVDCFENGVIPDANQCFHNAMSIFAPALPQSLCQEALGKRNFPPSHCQPLAMQAGLEPESVAMDEQDSPTASLSSQSVPAAAEEKKSTEYDEGMNTYNRPLRIDSSLSCNSNYCYQSTVPVLLFNIGQLHVLGGDDASAVNYFMYALNIIDSTNINSAACIPIQTSRANETVGSMDAIPILHNLGRIYYRAQNYKLAMSMYVKALDIANEPQNNDMRACASALNCLGVIFFHMSTNSDAYATKALAVLTTSLTIRKSLLASSNGASVEESRKEIATTMNNIGRVHYMLGNHAAALETYVEAYGLRKALLPENHLDLAASAFNLGQTHHQLGNLDEAMALYKEFYDKVSKVLSPSHSDNAIILKCIAQVHHDKSQYDEAAKLYHMSLALTQTALGELHPEVASTLNKIGNMYYENSDFDNAIKVYEKGLTVEKAVLRRDHQKIVVTLTNIAQSYKHQGDHHKAHERYTEAYNLQRKLLGPAHPKVAVALSNVAQANCRLGRFASALDAYQEVVQIRREAFGDDHVDVASTLNSIGLILFQRGCHSVAIESFRESLRIRKLCLGDLHRDVAVVMYNIATTQLEQGDEDEAMACYAETLRMERATLGADHPDLVMTLQHIGQVFRQRGEFDVALEYFSEVLRIERLHHGNDSLLVARLLNKMGNVYLQKADVPKMMECFAEATRVFEALGSSADEDEEAENDNEELKITGYNFYCLSLFHPECAAAA